VTDLIGRNEVKIKYCSTDEMIVIITRNQWSVENSQSEPRSIIALNSRSVLEERKMREKVKFVDSEEKESNESSMSKQVREMSLSAKPEQCLR
jgi:hypothetical protein